MYKNTNKISVSIVIWSMLSVFAFTMGFVFIGLIFSDNVTRYVIVTKAIYLLLAAGCLWILFKYFKNLSHFARIYKMNELFMADEDGFIPLAELSREIGDTEIDLRKYIEYYIRKGYLVNLNYDASSKAFLLSDRITAHESHPGGRPENKPFVGIHCPGCAASLKIRVNTLGNCPYCGRSLIASGESK